MTPGSYIHPSGTEVSGCSPFKQFLKRGNFAVCVLGSRFWNVLNT